MGLAPMGSMGTVSLLALLAVSQLVARCWPRHIVLFSDDVT